MSDRIYINRPILGYIFSILLISLPALAQKSTPQTDITVPSDTTCYQPPPAKKPDPREPKLELPDVLILGKDQYHRTVKSKKELTPESPSLVREEAAYEPVSTWFRRAEKKPHFEKADSLAIRQIWAKIKGGSYFTVEGETGAWQRLKQGDAAAYVWFGRSDGQFINSKYGEAGLSGTFSYEVAPKVKALFKAEYSRHNRGLQKSGYRTDNAVRNAGTGWLSANLQYDVNSLSDGNLGVEFGGLAMSSDSSGREIDKSDVFYYDVHFDYTTQYKKTQLQTRGRYVRETLETQMDSARSQSGFGTIGVELLQPLSSYFTAALGADFQVYTLDSLDSKSRIAPYGRINFIPSAQVGLSLHLSSGYMNNMFAAYWQDNAYVAHRVSQQPTTENFAFTLRGDVKITEHIKFRGSFSRQWMREMFYWQVDTTSGLFSRLPISDTKLSEVELGVVAEISKNTRLQASFIDYSDRISDNVTQGSDNTLNRLPYRPDFRIPVRASIQLLPDLNLTLTADIVGQRKKNIVTDDAFPAHGLLHIDLSYDISKRISALLSAHNVLDTKYVVWEGYPETGIVVLGGIRVRL
ncbi:hypothetical protein JXA70_10910 [candidate division KSB1 bacterium]|nr:hypothetical protein [candidate division KSB1 bacterium]